MTPLWSTRVGTPLRGLALARERGWLLTWDAQRLHLYERDGRCRVLRDAPAPLAAACLADDGSVVAAAGTGGEVWLLDAEFKLRWEKKLPSGGHAVACDPFGQFVAASDQGNNLLLFDSRGRVLGQTNVPRALRRLAFVAERPYLIGAADFGLVACFDAKLECVWRDGLVANIGSLAVSGDGGTIALAGFSQGLYCYELNGPPHRWLSLPSVCRLADLRYDGKRVLMSDPTSDLLHVDLHGKVRDAHGLPAAPVAIALTPLGDVAAAALADGTLLALGVK